jgi:predicted Fe-Mo cluster-binding NifX family protein
MKIAVAVKSDIENPVMSPLFGKATFFAIATSNLDYKDTTIIEPSHSHGTEVIDYFYNIGVNTLLISRMGLSPYNKAKSMGMKIFYVEQRKMPIDSLLEQLKLNNLEEMTDSNMEKCIK